MPSEFKPNYLITFFRASIRLELLLSSSCANHAPLLLSLAISWSAAGCSCTASVFDGHWTGEKTSLLHMHAVPITQSLECILSITILNTTNSGDYKVNAHATYVVLLLSQCGSAGFLKLSDLPVHLIAALFSGQQ